MRTRAELRRILPNRTEPIRARASRGACAALLSLSLFLSRRATLCIALRLPPTTIYGLCTCVNGEQKREREREERTERDMRHTIASRSWIIQVRPRSFVSLHMIGNEFSHSFFPISFFVTKGFFAILSRDFYLDLFISLSLSLFRLDLESIEEMLTRTLCNVSRNILHTRICNFLTSFLLRESYTHRAARLCIIEMDENSVRKFFYEEHGSRFVFAIVLERNASRS